jgi:hypothetical protein
VKPLEEIKVPAAVGNVSSASKDKIETREE